MCSTDIFAVIIILLLVLVIMAKTRQVEQKKEFMVKDFRPKAYLIYSSDPAKCTDCSSLVDRFLLMVGRKDRYISYILDVERPATHATIANLEKKHNVKLGKLPTLVVDDGRIDVHEGTEIIRLVIRDMV